MHDRLRDVDAVPISHLHRDHLDVPSLRALGRETPIVVPAGAGSWLRGDGFRDVRELAVGETAEIGSVVVRAVPAVHSGFRPPLGPTAPPLGYVVRGSRSVYFAGDTDLFDAMGELGGPIDMALIPVWGWGPTLGRGRHLDPLRAAQALRLIRPRAAIAPPAAFVEYAAELAPGVQTVPTAVGDVVSWEA